MLCCVVCSVFGCYAIVIVSWTIFVPFHLSKFSVLSTLFFFFFFFSVCDNVGECCRCVHEKLRLCHILMPSGDGLLRIMIQFSRLNDDKRQSERERRGKNEEIIAKSRKTRKQLPLVVCNVDEPHEIDPIFSSRSLLSRSRLIHSTHLSVIFLTAHFNCLILIREAFALSQ